MSLRKALHEQAGYCARLGSPFTARLLRLLAERWPPGTTPDRIACNWTGDLGPDGASFPLRLAAGLHALTLGGKAHALAAAYPPHAYCETRLWHAVEEALTTHKDFWQNWLHRAPQTNEVRRAVALMAAAGLLAERFPQPMQISELGASGGLNLMFDRFHMKAGGQRFCATVTRGVEPPCLAPDWQGPLPRLVRPKISERRGVDLHPLDLANEGDALRLLAYIWPDQPQRMARTRAAIAVQIAATGGQGETILDKGDAIAWLGPRLDRRLPGMLHLVYHTVAWQYFPKAAQRRGTAMIEAAGAQASEDSPLAWLRLEADRHPHGAALSLRLWPGDCQWALARVDFHGRWVKWEGPVQLPHCPPQNKDRGVDRA